MYMKCSGGLSLGKQGGLPSERILSQSCGAGWCVVYGGLVVSVVVMGGVCPITGRHVVHFDFGFGLRRKEPRYGQRMRRVFLFEGVGIVGNAQMGVAPGEDVVLTLLQTTQIRVCVLEERHGVVFGHQSWPHQIVLIGHFLQFLIVVVMMDVMTVVMMGRDAFVGLPHRFFFVIFEALLSPKVAPVFEHVAGVGVERPERPFSGFVRRSGDFDEAVVER